MKIKMTDVNKKNRSAIEVFYKKFLSTKKDDKKFFWRNIFFFFSDYTLLNSSTLYLIHVLSFDCYKPWCQIKLLFQCILNFLQMIIEICGKVKKNNLNGSGYSREKKLKLKLKFLKTEKGGKKYDHSLLQRFSFHYSANNLLQFKIE